MLATLTAHLNRRHDLSAAQVREAVHELTSSAVESVAKADFLIALSTKGESIAEIAAFVRELRRMSIVPPISPALRRGEILDVCGTGGDKLNTFNISTTVALVAASAGVPVAKHGNRAITSKSGSADVLEALGVATHLSPEAAAFSLERHCFAFFLASNFHPSFRHIAEARRICAERGQRTIFNFVGPLLNPAHPTAQLVGVATPELCTAVAEVLRSSGVRRGMVVSGRAGEGWLDELSPLGESKVVEFYQDRAVSESMISPEDLMLERCNLEDLAGGDSAVNAKLIEAILAGQDKGPRRTAVLLNAGAALFVAGRTKSIQEGIEMAGGLLDSGATLRKLEALRQPLQHVTEVQSEDGSVAPI